MLTALSVARDCDMIPDDAKIIAIEATESDDTPTFSYAQVYNRRVKEVRYDQSVRINRKHKNLFQERKIRCTCVIIFL